MSIFKSYDEMSPDQQLAYTMGWRKAWDGSQTIIRELHSYIDLIHSHQGVPASQERIKEAHSAMHVQWLKEGYHFSYKQSHDEKCYICTLLGEVERLTKLLGGDPLGFMPNGMEDESQVHEQPQPEDTDETPDAA